MFSVIIPVYNGEEYIGRSIKSVLSQTCGEFELIIVDDGSTDNTAAAAAVFRDNRIKYVKQNNSGVSAARNKGIGISKGSYICFLDADDIWLPEHLAVLSEMAMKFPGEKIYITGHIRALKDGTEFEPMNDLPAVYGDIFKTDDIFSLVIQSGHFFHTNSMCIAKDVFDTVGGFAVGEKKGEDTDMWFRAGALFDVVICRKATTMYCRENSTATAARELLYDWIFEKRENEITDNKNIPERKRRNIIACMDDWRISKSRYCLLEGHRRRACAILKSVRYKKSNLKKIIITAACFAVPRYLLNSFYNKKHSGYYS